MREGWEYKKLGEVVTKIADGSHNPPHGVEYSAYPMLSSKNVFFDYYNYDAPRYLSKEEFEEENKRTEISDDDVLLTIVGTIGRTCCVKSPFVPFTLQRSVAVLKPNHNYLTSRYLMYALHSLSDFWNREAKGVAQKGVYLKQLASIPIPVPPIEEQERIVSELDLLSGIIEKKKEQLKEYDKLAQSIFYDMFGDPITNEKGWEVKKLGECVHEMFLGPFGSALKVDSYVSKEVSYCMVYEQKHAIQGTINLDNHYIDKEKYNSLQRFEVKPNDFIMSCRGTIGKLYQLPNDAPMGIIHPSLMKIRIKEEILNPTYFKFMLVKIVANESTNGNCVQMAITAKELGKKNIQYPPLSLQQSFAEKIEAIEKQKALVQQSISETQTLFDSTMDKYFG